MNQTTCRTGMLGYRTALVHKALRLAAVAGLAIMLAGPVTTASGQPGVPVSEFPPLQQAPNADKSPKVVVERASGRLKLSGQDGIFTIEVGPDVIFGDIVEALSSLYPKPANIVLDPELESRRGDIVPPITLRNVNSTAILETLIWHISNAWTGLPNRVQMTYSGGAVSAWVIRLSLAAPTSAGNTASGESAATVEFFAITDLLDGMERAGAAKPDEQLKNSIDLGLQALREKGSRPEITVHIETGLLIVRATPRQMGVIRSAINAVQARTQSELRKVLSHEKTLAELKSIESATRDIDVWLAESLKLAEELEKGGTPVDPKVPLLYKAEAEKQTLRLRERAAELQLKASTTRPALLDAPPIGGSAQSEAYGGAADSAIVLETTTADPVAAMLADILRDKKFKIAGSERALEGPRRKLEELIRKLQVVPAAKPAEGGK